MFTEKEMRRAIREQLRAIVTKHHLKKIHEKKEEDIDFQPEESGFNLPKGLLKLLDPDITPQKFAQLDAMLDDSGKPAQQAVAVAVFALNYADNDLKGAKSLLQKAIQVVPQLLKQKTGEDQAET